MVSSQSHFLVVSAALGVGSHVLFFRFGEHHLHALLYIQLAIVVVPVLLSLTALLTDIPLLKTFKLLVQAELTFLFSLSLSTTFYRFSPFHRLASFPGPLTWRWSKLAQSYANRNLRGFEVLDELHQGYGEYVRTGPCEISVIDPDAVEVILGSASKCTRPPWFDINPLRSILTVRDEQEHRSMRRAWEHGLREQALVGYESRITERVAAFVRLLKAQGPVPTNVSSLIKFLVLDINNRVGFSRKTEALETGKPPPGLNYLEDGLHFLGFLGPVPWFFILLLKIPFIAREFNRGAEYCRKLVADRLEDTHAGPDIVGSLISAAPRTDSVYETSFALRGQSNVLIVASNDAVASTAAFCLYNIACQPHHATLLRQEIDEIRREHGNIEAMTLRMHAKHLNAVIFETLRLHPANPSGSFRATPRGGLYINKRYIPEDVTVSIPSYSLMRSPKCFVRPNEFVPERWTSEPELILRRDSFIPFYIGAYGCAGRQLALMELRIIVAHLIQEFTISFAPQESGQQLLKESKDHFNMSPAPLFLEFH